MNSYGSTGTAISSSRLSSTRDSAGLLELDEATCAKAIGQGEFPIKHSIHRHPLLALEALAELSDKLPPAAVECHKGKQSVLVPGGCEDVLCQPSEIVRGIADNGHWMVLWNVEQIREYRQLLNEILDPVESYLPVAEGGMGRREAFIFLSAPNSVTPVHFDPENNFLLQISGSKQFHVGRFPDQISALRELDRYHDGGHRNLEEKPPCSNTFQLQAGDGVYLYPWAPHWVFNGSVVSISLSITFRTRRSEKEELVHMCNSRLRQLGYSPAPLGKNRLVDSTKAAYIGFKGWLRRGGKKQLGTRDFS